MCVNGTPSTFPTSVHNARYNDIIYDANKIHMLYVTILTLNIYVYTKCSKRYRVYPVRYGKLSMNKYMQLHTCIRHILI